MKLKSAHRKERPQPADIPTVEIDGAQPESVSAVSIEAPEGANSEAVQEALQTAVQSDDAAEALRKQIAEVRRAEEMQRLAAKAANSPALLSPEDRIALWRANGLTDREADFLTEHPHMMDAPQVVNHASALALQDYERDTPEYFDAVRENFEEAMRQLQSQAAQGAPEFFQPPMPKQPAPRSEASFVSAPVSRDGAPSGGSRTETNPSKITLTAEQVEAAKIAGISTVEYARQLLRLRSEPQGTRQQ
jgi:hypothetical protein